MGAKLVETTSLIRVATPTSLGTQVAGSTCGVGAVKRTTEMARKHDVTKNYAIIKPTPLHGTFFAENTTIDRKSVVCTGNPDTSLGPFATNQ